jgi:colanic acid biosynthesis glycosyl transferase WcaI
VTTDIAAESHLRLPSQRSTDRLPGPGDSVRGRNILIVGINYWPEPTGIAPYTTGMAEYLAEHAASVEVLTGLPSYPSWTVAPQYRRGLRFTEERNGVQVRRLKHFVPLRQDALRRGAYELSYFAHATSAQPTVRPDVVIGVTPALAGASVATRIARRYRAPLLLLVQDLLGQAAAQTGIRGGGKVAAAVRRWERSTLMRADAIAVVSDAFRPPLEAYGLPVSRVHTVPNWCRATPSTADRAATRADLGWTDGLCVALHTGNMGLKQDLGNVVEAARLTQDRSDVLWVLMGDGSQRAALVEQGRGLTNLQFLPLCDATRYHDVLAAADVLLMNERAGVSDMSLPSKLTSYFASGVVVVSAVSSEGSTARELARAGALAPAPPGDAGALARQVLELRAEVHLRARHAAAAARYAAEHLSFGSTAKRLDAALAEAIASNERTTGMRWSA